MNSLMMGFSCGGFSIAVLRRRREAERGGEARHRLRAANGALGCDFFEGGNVLKVVLF
jgi:hypothetical protein